MPNWLSYHRQTIIIQWNLAVDGCFKKFTDLLLRTKKAFESLKN